MEILAYSATKFTCRDWPDTGTCIEDSFDGVANMSGVYSGLQVLMKAARPSHIHTWCYAHVLNLVISDASSVCVAAISLFGLLTELCRFSMISIKG